MEYIKTVKLKGSEFERLNKLLEVPCFEELSDDEFEGLSNELGLKMDDSIPLFEIKFENGNIFYIDINSGNENYYDDMWMAYTDGTTEVYDCTYELTHEINVWDKEGNSYLVIIEEE